jgi:hypothetical protein
MPETHQEQPIFPSEPANDYISFCNPPTTLFQIRRSYVH